jgi:hypothetical protein
MRQKRQDVRRDHQPLFRLSPLAAVATASLVAGCHKPLTHAECSEMLDHYVELLVKSERPDATGEQIQHLQTEARHEAASDPNFASCASQVSRSEWQCAMSAQNPDQLEQCLM